MDSGIRERLIYSFASRVVIHYRKGPCPAKLEEFAATPGADWGGFGARHDVRTALVRDQRVLCAYCQRRIHPSVEMKIDHWVARCNASSGKTLELDWHNLVGACSGITGLDRHCDTSRGDESPSNQDLFLGPVVGRGADPRQHVRYQANGNAYAFPADPRVENDIALLNLNAYVLKRGREVVILELETRLKKVGFTQRHVQQMLDQLEHGVEAREYAEVARDYLRRKRRRLS